MSILSSQVYDDQTGKYSRIPGTHERKDDISDQGSKVQLCEMLAVSASQRMPLCEIPSDVCDAFLRQYLVISFNILTIEVFSQFLRRPMLCFAKVRLWTCPWGLQRSKILHGNMVVNKYKVRQIQGGLEMTTSWLCLWCEKLG